MAPRQRSPPRELDPPAEVLSAMPAVDSSVHSIASSAIESVPLVRTHFERELQQHRDQHHRRRPSQPNRKASLAVSSATGGGDGSGPSASVVDRDRHDLFNLVALLPVILLTLSNFDWSSLRSGRGPEASWTDEYFWEYWVITALYFAVDLVWVYMVRTCVKSPMTIIKHHVVTIIYLAAPVLYPEYRWCMGACLSVEINTWFLIARRVAHLRRDVTPAVVSDCISFLFYLSWVAIRCILYPYIMAFYVQKAQIVLKETGTLMHWPIVFVPMHFILCALNLKWSYDLLLRPVVDRWSKDAEVRTVSDGL